MSIIPSNSIGRRPDGYRLVSRLLALSNAKDWEAAEREWRLLSISFAPADDPGRCLCGHAPIIEQCVIGNTENGNEAMVGNVCVTRFLGLPSEQLFAPIRRIVANIEASVNSAVLAYARSMGWVTDWELEFYVDTARRQRGQLSPRQLVKRVEINEAILRRLREDCHA